VADGELEYQCRHSASTETQSTTANNRVSRTATPLDKLDHVLFFTSYQQKLHGNLFSMPSGGVPDVGYSHEYRLVSSSSSPSKVRDKNHHALPPTATPVFSVTYITEGIDGDILRTIFLISDVLVLIYRMTRTCWTVRLIRRRYARCRCDVDKFPATTSTTMTRLPRCGLVNSDSSSITRFASVTSAADCGNVTSSSSSFRGHVSASDSQFQLQSCCHGDAANIYTDPQTLSVQTKVGNNIRTSSTGLQRTVQGANTKRVIGELFVLYILLVWLCALVCVSIDPEA